MNIGDNVGVFWPGHENTAESTRISDNKGLGSGILDIESNIHMDDNRRPRKKRIIEEDMGQEPQSS
jgi:hypothetical protein